MPRGARFRKDLPSNHQQASREMPQVRQARGAAGLGRRRRPFQGLGFLRDRLQTARWSIGTSRQKGREKRQAGRVEITAEERLKLRQVKAPDAIRAALIEAAAKLGAPNVEVALERPRD